MKVALARALSPEVARTRIRAAAEQAVRDQSATPFVIPGPHRLEIDLNSVAFAADGIAAAAGWVNTISAMSAMLR